MKENGGAQYVFVTIPGRLSSRGHRVQAVFDQAAFDHSPLLLLILKTTPPRHEVSSPSGVHTFPSSAAHGQGRVKLIIVRWRDNTSPDGMLQSMSAGFKDRPTLTQVVPGRVMTS